MADTIRARPEVSGGLVAPLVFKTSVGLNKVPGGFDSHSPPCWRLGLAGFAGECAEEFVHGEKVSTYPAAPD